MIDVRHRLLVAFLQRDIEGCLAKRGSLSSLAIENLGDLFKGSALCLREKEVDRRNHGCQRANVDEVELPGDGFKSDGVAELVEAEIESA